MACIYVILCPDIEGPPKQETQLSNWWAIEKYLVI